MHVNLLIGPFSGEREETIQFYWRDLAKGTPGEGASLHFQHDSIEVRCLSCGGTFDSEDGESICKYCQTDSLQLSREDEIRIVSIEIE